MSQEVINSIEELERGIVKLIILAVNEISFGLGMRNTIKYLRGIQTTLFYEHKLNNKITFGKLSHMKAVDLQFILNMMVGCELLKTEKIDRYGDSFDIIKVTDEGLKYVNGLNQTNLTFLDCFGSPAEIELNDKQKNLFENLRKIRRELANKANFPPYCVCSDSVLKTICINTPTTKQEFLAIKGIGQRFVDKYFDSFQPEILKSKNETSFINNQPAIINNDFASIIL